MTKVTIDREERYTVIKHKDLTADDRSDLDQLIQSRHIPTRKCLVIESDWPEYEPAWRMIEARVTGASTKPATVPEGAAESIAEMVAEWVDGGIRMNTDWRSGLAGIITKRLSRFAAHAPVQQASPWVADTEAAIQLAFELGGLEDGSYHLEADELERVLRAALPPAPEVV